MKVTGDQLKELEARCDRALVASTAREQLQIMGGFLNANIPSLPVPIRSKFRRVLDGIAQKTIMG